MTKTKCAKANAIHGAKTMFQKNGNKTYVVDRDTKIQREVSPLWLACYTAFYQQYAKHRFEWVHLEENAKDVDSVINEAIIDLIEKYGAEKINKWDNPKNWDKPYIKGLNQKELAVIICNASLRLWKSEKRHISAIVREFDEDGNEISKTRLYHTDIEVYDEENEETLYIIDTECSDYYRTARQNVEREVVDKITFEEILKRFNEEEKQLLLAVYEYGRKWNELVKDIYKAYTPDQLRVWWDRITKKPYIRSFIDKYFER